MWKINILYNNKLCKYYDVKVFIAKSYKNEKINTLTSNYAKFIVYISYPKAIQFFDYFYCLFYFMKFLYNFLLLVYFYT